MTTRSAPPLSNLTLLPDPPRDRVDMQQSTQVANAIVVLRDHFYYRLGRTDALVNGDGYLCQNPGEARRSPHPDCIVALNLPIPPERIEDEANGYTISEIGQPPDFVLEIASATTGERDYTTKRDIYAALGVREYWRFDHTGGRYHEVPLAGDVLIGESYEPLPIHREPDGTQWGYSPALDLELCWVERHLRFRDPVTKEFLPTMAEERAEREDAVAELDAVRTERDTVRMERDAARAERDAAEARSDAAMARQDAAESERDAARAERDAAQARARELEEEIRRLRGQ